MDSRTIVLTGFMGAGKTSVGRVLAELLDRSFVDMDERLQAREGMTIAELFAARGEAYFRERESALCRELAAEDNLVIATGGGALVNPTNRELFHAAHLVCLDVSADTVLERLDGSAVRPLLQGDARANVVRLMQERRAAYAEIPMHVQTDGWTPGEIAREILRRLEPRDIPVKTPQGAYPIVLGRELLDELGNYLASFPLAARCAVVTDTNVAPLYGSVVCRALAREGYAPALIMIPAGEQAKNLDTVRTLYDEFIAAKLERRSAVIALGGGVVGDTVGLAAATFLRGVPLVQVPTTLLALIDSSIGGKVAVDLPAGKNLVGAFKFPLAVIADLSVLDTLPIEEFRAGMAEVIKHGILGDAGLFHALQAQAARRQDAAALDADLIDRALRVKIAVVERDPFEENVRAHLNLGHTFGQALERLAGYQMRHGEAVAIGIAVAARLAALLGLCSRDACGEIIDLLRAFQLPTALPADYTPQQIVQAMGTDKKIKDGKLRLILPRAIGQVEIVENLSESDILRALHEAYA